MASFQSLFYVIFLQREAYGMVEHLFLETQEFSSGDIFLSLFFFHFLHSLLVLFFFFLGGALGTLFSMLKISGGAHQQW